MSRGRPLVLCYHAISSSWPHELSVAPSSLARQLRFVLARGFPPASLEETVQNPRRKLLHVTFDDAYASVLNAVPVLDSLGAPATVFVCASHASEGGVVDPRYLDHEAQAHPEKLRSLRWDELRELAARGHEIGSHSLTHRRLTEAGDDELGRELRDSRELIESELGRRCRYLSYPHADQDARVRAAARQAGYEAAFVTLWPIRGSDRYALPRVAVYRKDNLLRFAFKLSLVASRVAPLVAAARSRRAYS
jgi:peptidoglycan/xylan/chitin deacetylase (PgdA/CDA1 family)